MAAATEPPRKYWLKHECRDGTIHTGASGLPLASLPIVADQVGGVQSLVVAAAVRIYIGGFGGGRVEGAVVDC